jgi:hypothetical protein
MSAPPINWILFGKTGCTSPLLAAFIERGWLVENKDFVRVPNEGSGPKDQRWFNPDSIGQAKLRQASEKVAKLQARGHRVGLTPPVGGIPFDQAVRKHRVAPETIWKHVDEGRVAAGLSDKLGRNGQPVVLVQTANLERALAETKPTREGCGNGEPPPANGEPVEKLANEFGFDNSVIRKWCKWNPHPALGRQIRFGVGRFEIQVNDGAARHAPRQRAWRGLLVSRADVATISEMTKDPYDRVYAGNPGMWITQEIFKLASGELCYIEPHIVRRKKRFRLPDRTAYSRLKPIKVVWPPSRGGSKTREEEEIEDGKPTQSDSRQGHPTRWIRNVYPRSSIDSLVALRSGKTEGGQWFYVGDLWSDPEGLWYSGRFIDKQVGRKGATEYCVRVGLLSRSKKVSYLGTYHAIPGRAKSVAIRPTVYHESEVHPLLGVGVSTTAAQTVAPLSLPVPEVLTKSVCDDQIIGTEPKLPELHPCVDGPGERFVFRYAGAEVDLCRSQLRYRLLAELWDAENRRPHLTRSHAKVLDAIYPDDEEAESSLRQLAWNINQAFDKRGILLAIRLVGAKIWLEIKAKT